MDVVDFADWYAENTDADYDDIIKKVTELSTYVYQEGYRQGQERVSLDRDETVCNCRSARK